MLCWMSRVKSLAVASLSRMRRPRLVLAVAAVALAAGVAASVAVGGSSRPALERTAAVHRRAHAAGSGLPAWHGDVPVAAAYLGRDAKQVRRSLRAGSSLAAIAAATPGKSDSGLVEALVAARARRLQAAAAAGRLSKKAEQRRLSRLRARVAAEVARKGGPAAGRGAAVLAPVASYLGVRVGRLRLELRTGRTLAQIADATPGRSAAGLIAALVADAKARLDAAVAAGRLSASAEARRLQALPARVTARVNHRRRTAHAKHARSSSG
jgi:hypothetical protein